ncbi:peroxiredoxin [Oribacterium sp. C9]|uniref:peroxiredoxin-like family protein n=1 Tax=Oribacterium sp. C9 TaxID=1943579 RepID=UPI00098F8281|nr:peroxiredoxin-like family protein [Oribacterium sp. C9]OON86986.1 peroxiredoxin [Oribacterium sp. C9]
MAKLNVGDTMPDFQFQTPFSTDRQWYSELEKNDGKTAIIFLRYYGCTLCQLDIRTYAKEFSDITEGGGRFYVVLQSDPQKIAKDMEEKQLPFEIICDPEMKLYREFEIPCAESMKAMADAKTMLKVGKATMAGLKHGDYEGEELQLPATFVMDSEGKISYSHYGKSAGDVPAPKELKELIAS